MSDRDVKVIQQWLNKDLNGLSDDGIAKVNGISRRTLVNIRQKHSDYITFMEELKDLQLEQEQEQAENNGISDINVTAEIYNVLRLVLTRARSGSIKDIEIILKYSDKFVEIDKKIQKGSTDLESILEDIENL
ncbi:hypothetical protein [Clostridium sp.]|uniref:hypothetical protein n=1 Tax=Clostridium sp. TaxID=1506 RepID=UPI001D3D878A|nr:hypothetical protein [Clostridium sp.]MBS5938972.1 hypothetical protein [Clostridium sp.]